MGHRVGYTAQQQAAMYWARKRRRERISGGVVQDPSAPVVVIAPIVSGDAAVGSILTSSTGNWTGFPSPFFTYQWRRNAVNISGATSSTYTTIGTDVGTAVDCVVTATNSEGSANADSNDITVTQAPVVAVAPVVSGAAAVGSELSCTTGTWSGHPAPTFSYQWRRDGVAISGATAATYTTVDPTDIGAAIDCLVTGTNSEGSSSADSNDITVTAGATTDPNIQAIDTDGWRAQYDSAQIPVEFDPVGDAKVAVVTRSGFNSSGSATTVNDTVTLMKRVRQVYPSQASLTTDRVSLSDTVFASDTITGLTNNSTEAYPLPIAAWENAQIEIAEASTHTVRLCVAHGFARNGLPVAAVRFTATDENTNSVSATVSTLTTKLHSVTGFTSCAYEWDVPLATLTEGDLVTVDAEIFPWVGTKFTLSTDADTWPSPNLSVLKFYNNKNSGLTRYIAYADGVGGGSPQASTNDATAAANPYAEIDQAFAAARTANGGSSNGIIVKITAATHTADLDFVTNTEEPKCPPIFEASGGAAARDTTIIQPAANGTKHPFRAIWRNVTIRKPSGNVIAFFGQSTLAKPGLVTFENINWDEASNGVYGATIYLTGIVTHVDCTGDYFGQLQGFSTTYHAIKVVGSKVTASALVNSAITSVIGSEFREVTIINHDALAARPAYVGQFIGWSRLERGALGDPLINFDEQVTGTRGVAVVGSVVEVFGTSTGPVMHFHADGPYDSQNLVLQMNTMVGGRINHGYEDATASRTHKQYYETGNLVRSWNCKSDVFLTNGSRVGNWSVIHKTGIKHNAMILGSDQNDVPGAGNWIGEVAGIGEVIGTNASPLAVNFTNDQSNEGGDAGGGNYLPTAQGDIPSVPGAVVPFSHDIAGTAIATDGTAIAGALQI